MDVRTTVKIHTSPVRPIILGIVLRYTPIAWRNANVWPDPEERPDNDILSKDNDTILHECCQGEQTEKSQQKKTLDFYSIYDAFR